MNTVTIVIETLTTGTGFNIFYQNMGLLYVSVNFAGNR